MKSSSPIPKVLVEVCVDSLASAVAAHAGGASRVELCTALSEGGLTPSAGIIEKARQMLPIGIFVMIRPRTGNFIYSRDEFDAMIKDIETARSLGANGIVTGFLNQDGTVDSERTSKMVKIASPLPVTFHRAFDLTPNPFIALEDIIASGCTRLLTSGQQPNAIEGMGLIKELIQRAGKRIIVMPGSGVKWNNVASLIRSTGAEEVHLSGRKKLSVLTEKSNSKVGNASFNLLYETDPLMIRRVLLKANFNQETSWQ